jgi:CO/xanthine dehydrogenase Mo-binding subunit
VAAGEYFDHLVVRRGDPDAHGEIVVEGVYETGTQDQAPLGTEAGIALPDGAGGVDIFGPSQWVHVDHEQLVACLGLAPDQVRVHPAGLGGAFGAREDLSVQTHLGMLALGTGRPVKAVYDRRESFAGHVKRHAARMWYRHEADRDGNLVRVEARIILDGGAYHMTSLPVLTNSTYFAAGAYRCPNTFVESWAARTNHPPAGAMRGFGSNQVIFAVESQMDRLADALEMDRVQFRLRNALQQGDELATSGQRIEYALPAATVLETVAAMPLPDDEPTAEDPRHLPGGTGLTTPSSAVRRAVGYALGIKNIAFSAGFHDDAEARVELTPDGAVVHTAAIEVGQGMVTVLEQIARSTLGIERVEVVFDHTGHIGSAGSTSASRQTPMTGNAVLRAAAAVREQVLDAVGGDDLTDAGVWRGGQLVAPWAQLVADGPIEASTTFAHPATEEPDADGQGHVHVDFCVAAHRAVVDVDPDLGLVRIVRIDTAQDVGRALNPGQVLGQIEGGIAQGLGLAVMEELVLDHGMVKNPTFTDYLLPTALDVPDVEAVVIEEPSPWGPFGAKGFAELPSISVTPAIVAAIRAATGKELRRVPVHPSDIVGLPAAADATESP